ncbi:SH3 domain-containing protein C23A1.17-like [Lasiodiplodia theobromae]|uniref:SH3 domain-containing protein C23A1.17-like n=1 Tax=Lasiodiplodia theobromae TaxID=45133 RepID=UPI0015C3E4C7|nr:SH3 domain-containing protein C23A1.17-like [Lasiodiplodia theobromae]KAF4536874.1 SH3 domain-containing protein C23A1.17-like [Lasiodiplodia theobromae]
MKEAIRSPLRRRSAHVSKTDNPDYTRLAAPCLDIELRELILEMWYYDQSAHDVFRDPSSSTSACRLIVVRFDCRQGGGGAEGLPQGDPHPCWHLFWHCFGSGGGDWCTPSTRAMPEAFFE